MGIMGMIPMTGVPLPFMSYGGSYTISLIIALSLVQRVSIDSKDWEWLNAKYKNTWRSSIHLCE